MFHESCFLTRISPNLYWVPFNSLGKSRYRNDEMRLVISKKKPDEIKALKLNLYEAIQLFQASGFQEVNDIERYDENGTIWEIHKSGKFAVEANQGCCSTAAAWLNYVVSEKYPQRGYLHYIRPDGSGHVANYLNVENYYYIVDMTTQTSNNVDGSPKETGVIRDYLASEYNTGICFRANSLLDFARYHARIQKTKGFHFSYFEIPPDLALPPCYIEYIDDILYIHQMTKANKIYGDATAVQHGHRDLGEKYTRVIL